MRKKTSITFFGTYDKNFTSNKIVLNGLRLNDAIVTVVNSHTPLTRLDSKKDMSWIKLTQRILKKNKIFLEIVKNWKSLKATDYLYVGFPGHFDVLLAYPIAKIFRKKIIFNPLVVFYTGFVNDQGILKEGTVLASILKFGEKMIYKMTDVVIVDTELQKKHLHDLFNVSYSKMHTLAIGADNEIYKHMPKEAGKDTFNVVYYGLYSPLHGVEHIVTAAELCKDDKTIKFLMIGNGNTFESTVKEVKKRNLINVIFYPDMTELDAFSTLATGDVFLGFLQGHPTVDRVVPNKVYQGLAMGKGVISADSPVMREVFTHKKDIYLCDASSGKSLAEAINFLKNNPKNLQSMAKNGYELFIQKFTPSVIGRNLLTILNEGRNT